MKNKCIAVALSLFSTLAAAQDKYPSRPVTVIVPQAAGGANDVVARIVSQKLSENTGVSFVVDNRPGAGGNIGTAAAAKAPKDGYTIMLQANGAQVINPALYKSTGFDPVRDFEPVSLVATAAYLLVTNPTFPASNVKELIDAAKAKPGAIPYASAGNGTLNHLLGEMLKARAGIDLMHIPYKGAAASATDVIGGRVPVSVQSMPSVVSFIQSGKLKVIAVMNEKRVKALPDVPAVSETLPGFGATPWYGILVPAGTPKAVIERLHAETLKAMAAKDVQDKLAANGAEPATSTPDQFAAMIRAELPMWAKVVKESGAQLD